MGTVAFDTNVDKTVDITKNVNVNVNKNVTSSVALSGSLASAEASADATGGGGTVPGNGNGPISTDPLAVTPNADPNALADAILGAGVERVGDATLIGGGVQSGTFTDGGDVGMNSGVVFSSGDVSEIPGTNATGPETRGIGDASDDDLSTALGLPGDTDVADVVGGAATTHDAAGLEFTFQLVDAAGAPTSGDLTFDFVFGSEEYVDFIDSVFNDAFVLLVDGDNIGMTPGGEPISVNTVNDQANAGSYRNNVEAVDQFSSPIPSLGLSVKLDGLTTVLTATISGLDDDTHTFKVAVADVADEILDAAVFIAGSSFTTAPPEDPVSLLAETETFAQVTEDGAFSFSDALAARSGFVEDALL